MSSILVAFGIDAFWAERQDRRVELTLLVELRAEFVMNRESLIRTAEFYRATRGAMEALILAASSPGATSAASLDSIFFLASAPQHWEAATGALTTAVNSGRITLVQNGDLRSPLVGWDGITSDLYNDESARTDFVTRVLRPALAEFGIGGSPCAVSGADSEFGAALMSRTLRAHLRSQITLITHILTHYQDVETAITALIDGLDEELAARGGTSR